MMNPSTWAAMQGAAAGMTQDPSQLPPQLQQATAPRRPFTPQELQQLLQGANPGAQAARTQDASQPSSLNAFASRAPAAGMDQPAPADPTTPLELATPKPPELKDMQLNPMELKSLTMSMKLPPHNVLANPQDRGALDRMMNLEQGDVDKMRSMADQEEATPAGVNLSPIASLVDSWYGTNLQKGYTPPASPEERMKHLTGLRQLAAQGQQSVTKDQLSLLLGSDKSESNLMKAVLAASLKGPGSATATARDDQNIGRELQHIDNAHNLQTYVDYANQLGGSLAMMNKKGDKLSNKALNEVMLNLTAAITRTKGSSDYRQKQVDNPSVERQMAEIMAYATSNPNQAAPKDAIKFAKEMVQRIYDIYGTDISREAERLGVGKDMFNSVRVNAAVKKKLDYYKNGDMMNSMRKQYGIGPSEYDNVPEKPNTDKITDEEWQQATPEQRAAAIKAYGAPTKGAPK